MTWLPSLAAGGAVYLLVLALLGYRHGERPGRLAALLAHLRGEPPPRSRPQPGPLDGSLTPSQRLTLTALAGAVLFVGGLLFFRSWPLALILTAAAPLYPRSIATGRRQRRRELLAEQFGLALEAMAASLRAGASIRTAIERSAADLRRMLTGQKETPMVDELDRVVRDLELGFSVEEALVQFRDRLQTEDVTDFVEAVLLCRVRGGNVAHVMAQVAEIIQDKIAVQQQVLALTAGKRMEVKLLTIGPPLMVIYLGLTSPSYMAPLYETLVGHLILLGGTVCLAASYFIGRRLMQIDI